MHHRRLLLCSTTTTVLSAFRCSTLRHRGRGPPLLIGSKPHRRVSSASGFSSASSSRTTTTTTTVLGMMDPSFSASSAASPDTVVHHDSYYLLDDSDGPRRKRRSPMALVVLNMPIGRLGGMHDDDGDVDCDGGGVDGGDDWRANEETGASGIGPLFDRLWDAASHRVCADGGANRLHDYAARASLPTLVPDVITGDLDSLRTDVRSHYENLGCSIHRDPDQDTNDFDKALQAVERHQLGQGKDDGGDGEGGGGGDGGADRWTVCVYGAFGGRFDQTMASVQALYKWRGKFGQLVLYTDETSARLLEPCGCGPSVPSSGSVAGVGGGNGNGGVGGGGGGGEGEDGNVGGGEEGAAAAGGTTTTVTNVIRVPRARAGNTRGGTSIPVEGPSCGLLPIGGRCDGVWTTGLRWDLDGEALEFGGLVSTSNEVVGGGADGGGGGDPVGGIEGGGGGGGGGEDEDAGVDADAWVVTVRSSHPLVWTTEIR